MKRAALFDIDGTLIDSNDLHASAWGDAFRAYGIDLPHERIHGQIGKGGDNLMPAFLPPDLLDRHAQDIEKTCKEIFKRDYMMRIVPFPGVMPLFEALKDTGALIVLATSGSREELEHHSDLLGIGDLIDGATSRDDVEHSKPCPDIFQAALSKLPGLRPQEAIVVGDTPYDMQAASRAEITGVGVRCGGFPEADLRAAGAAALYDGPWSLPHRLADWLAD